MTLTYRYILIAAVTILAFSCGVEKKAYKAFESGEYQSSIDLYNKVLEKDAKHGFANYFIAESYRLSNRMHKAEPYYKGALDGGVANDSVGYNYAKSLKINGKYDEASSQLDNFLKSATDENWVNRINEESRNISALTRILDKKSYYRVKNLDGINTEASEYSPVYNDGELYFTSSRAENKIYKATGTPFTNIYKIKTKGANVELNSLEDLGEFINNIDINEGSVTFSPDGKTMVFARGNNGKKKGTKDVNLYITFLRNDKWTDPRMLNISRPDAWDSSPAFSRNGKILYFASNRKGGKGGTDIYSAVMNSRGRFSKVKNLGSKINTAGNEMFPYISDDGKMYFASDGHPGFGGLDLFVARRVNGQTAIDNLGKPVNSNADDFGMFLFKPDRGFFCSNREGGKGDDDIYTFVNEDPNLKIVNYFLRGVTMTHDDNNELKILPNVKVQLLDHGGEQLEETQTGQDGKFSFRVYEHEHYTLVGQKHRGSEQYLTTRESFNTVGRSIPQEELVKLVTNVTFDTVLVLEKIVKDKIFVLDNIYYDLDKANIRDDAALELDKLVTILVDNPEIKIELSSHTDDRAPDDYNMNLSQRRAKSAVEYIISQGIAKERLVAKGYGESRLIVKNAASEEEHQRNRRTEFKILEIGERPPDDTEEGEEGAQEDTFDEDRFFDDDGTEN